MLGRRKTGASRLPARSPAAGRRRAAQGSAVPRRLPLLLLILLLLVSLWSLQQTSRTGFFPLRQVYVLGDLQRAERAEQQRARVRADEEVDEEQAEHCGPHKLTLCLCVLVCSQQRRLPMDERSSLRTSLPLQLQAALEGLRSWRHSGTTVLWGSQSGERESRERQRQRM